MITDEMVERAAAEVNPLAFSTDHEGEFWCADSARVMARKQARKILTAALSDAVVVPREATWQMKVAARPVEYPHRNIFGEMMDADKDDAAEEIWRLMWDEFASSLAVTRHDGEGGA